MKFIDYNISYQEKLITFFKTVFQYMEFDLNIETKDNDLITIDKAYQDNGAFILALKENEIIGTIAIKRFNQNICELKRFYLLPEEQGNKIGYNLLLSAIKKAADCNYDFIRLDTTTKSEKAIEMFKNNSFYIIEKYNDDPYAEIYMERKLH